MPNVADYGAVLASMSGWWVPGGVLVLLVAVVIGFRRRRQTTLAGLVRGIAIPIALLYEAQGLYGLTTALGASGPFAYVLSGLTSALLITFALYADRHYERTTIRDDEDRIITPGNLGHNGRMMWYVGGGVGLAVACHATSISGFLMRLMVSFLAVLVYRARYVPDEPTGHNRHRQGSWIWTPRRIGVALGLLSPTDQDLVQVHTERRTRQLVAHRLAADTTTGWRSQRHHKHLTKLAQLATEPMLAEVQQRVHRARNIYHLTDTTPATESEATEATQAARPTPIRLVPNVAHRRRTTTRTAIGRTTAGELRARLPDTAARALAQEVASELAIQGVPVSNRTLAAGIRNRGFQISKARVAEILATLPTDALAS